MLVDQGENVVPAGGALDDEVGGAGANGVLHPGEAEVGEVAVPDAGHLVSLERPDAFNRALDAFLR